MKALISRKRIRPQRQASGLWGGRSALYLFVLALVLGCMLVCSSVITMPPEREQALPIPALSVDVGYPPPLSTPTPMPEEESAALAAATPSPVLEEESEPEPEPAPEPEYFIIAMMGDCILGSEHSAKGSYYAFETIVGSDYAYSFSLVRHLYEDADFVIVNLECTLTDYSVRQEKLFNFRGPPEYVNILVDGGVDFVALGNNHTIDYGSRGYDDTRETLSANGVGFAENGGWSLSVTDRGLTIGVFSMDFPTISDVEKAVAELKDAGAELIITALHWGEEGVYRPTESQKQLGRAAIDAGAHIVMGTHPHTLQPVEEYNGGVIYFSLANWVFGGNSNPLDKDSVIAKVIISRGVDGEISVFGMDNIPGSVSGSVSRNDYRPVPYDIGTVEYERVLSKLSGTFDGPDIGTSYREETLDSGDEDAANQPDG